MNLPAVPHCPASARFNSAGEGSSSFSCCLRLDDIDAFYAACKVAGLPEQCWGAPRLHMPKVEASGLRIGALIDPDGTLVRLIQN